MGRLWQTVILSEQSQLFRWIPVESVIRAHQAEYYDSISRSNIAGDCMVFLEFMTGAIREAIKEYIQSSLRERMDNDIELSPMELSVYSSIRDGDFRTIGLTARNLGVSRSTVERSIRRLESLNLIKRTGAKKRSEWSVIKESGTVNIDR